jgi:hypothetical protein
MACGRRMAAGGDAIPASGASEDGAGEQIFPPQESIKPRFVPSSRSVCLHLPLLRPAAVVRGKGVLMQCQMLKLGGKGELLCFDDGSFQATARCVAATFGQGGRSAPLELRLRGFFFLQLRRILDFSAAHQRRFQIKWFRPRSGSSGRCLEVNHGVGGGGPDRVSFFSSRSS